MTDGIERFRNPLPTVLETALLHCLSMRQDLAGRVITSAEMSAYILWMVESYGVGDVPADDNAFAALMSSSDISDIGRAILADPRDPAAQQRLTTLYEDTHETRFFQDARDISSGEFLRHLPPYWREDDYFEVYYAFSGSSPVFFSDETVRLSRGDVLLIPPGVRKACTLPDDDCAMLFFMIRKSTFSQVFLAHLSSDNLMSKFFRDALGGKREVPYLLFPTGGDDWIETLLYRIFEECRHEGAYSSRLVNSLMSSFFLTLLQGYEDTARVPSRSGMHWKPGYAEILHFIQQNYATITLGEVASGSAIPNARPCVSSTTARARSSRSSRHGCGWMARRACCSADRQRLRLRRQLGSTTRPASIGRSRATTVARRGSMWTESTRANTPWARRRSLAIRTDRWRLQEPARGRGAAPRPSARRACRPPCGRCRTPC